jgi:glycosyltransferase involved in cell wall biosynthesis
LHENTLKYNLVNNGERFKNGVKTKFNPINMIDIHPNGDVKISVIIPCLQEEKILTSHLVVYTNELKNKFSLEIIVSDGGSNDKTIEIAEKYADIVIKHKGDGRQTIAEGRNKGAEVAKGDILVFINADSLPSNPDMFFKFVSEWGSHIGNFASADALACYIKSFPYDTKIRDRIFYKFHNSYVRFLNFIGLGMGRGECQIVRKDVFNKVNGYNAEIVAGEDFDLYRRIGKIAKVKFAKQLIIYESSRRFRKYGYFRIISSWLFNAISVWFWDKSISKEWEAVR